MRGRIKNVVPSRNQEQLLFSGDNLNFQLTTDQQLTKIVQGGSTFILSRAYAICASGAFSGTTGGRLYSAASKSGNLTGFTTHTNLTAFLKIDVYAILAAQFTTGTMFFSLTNGNGAALTGSIRVYGFIEN
jgi:hypothetical protein